MKTRLFILLTICFCPLVCAQNIEEKFAAELAAKSRDVEYISCHFTETRHMQVITDEIVREGTFAYGNPAKIALNFTTGDLIVMNGDRFLMRIQGRSSSAKINSNPMFRQLQNILDACLTGNLNRLRQAGELSIEAGEQDYRMQIVPGSPAAATYISKIILLFDGSDMTLDELRFEQPSGDFTHYRFYNKKINEPVDEAVFKIQ